VPFNSEPERFGTITVRRSQGAIALRLSLPDVPSRGVATPQAATSLHHACATTYAKNNEAASSAPASDGTTTTPTGSTEGVAALHCGPSSNPWAFPRNSASNDHDKISATSTTATSW